MVCLSQFLVSLGFISFRIQTDENNTKELDFHVEILWDSLGFRVFYRFTCLGGFLSGFFQVSVEFHAGFASGILSVLPGSAAGAAALKSGDAVRWWWLSIALATRGRAGAAHPPLKSFSLVGFSRFSGSGVDKKRVKFQDAFWRS